MIEYLAARRKMRLPLHSRAEGGSGISMHGALFSVEALEPIGLRR